MTRSFQSIFCQCFEGSTLRVLPSQARKMQLNFLPDLASCPSFAVSGRRGVIGTVTRHIFRQCFHFAKEPWWTSQKIQIMFPSRY